VQYRDSTGYYSRSAYPQPSGRMYGQRELEAVNAVANGISSYRDLVAALVDANDGDTIEVVEAIEVSKSILVKNNRINITCTGRGAFVPAAPDLTLFHVEDADDCNFYNIKALRSLNGTMFKYFMEFVWVDNKKNIYVSDCYAEADNFLSFKFEFTALGSSPIDLVGTNKRNFLGQRTYIRGNTHRNFSILSIQDNYFVTGQGSMLTITENETEASIFIMGVGCIVNSNVVLGKNLVGTSIYVPSTKRNIITDNIVDTGGAPIVIADNISANNQEIG